MGYAFHQVKMQDDIKAFLDERGCKWVEADNLLEVRPPFGAGERGGGLTREVETPLPSNSPRDQLMPFQCYDMLHSVL
jgi:hypothetical protein